MIGFSARKHGSRARNTWDPKDLGLTAKMPEDKFSGMASGSYLCSQERMAV